MDDQQLLQFSRHIMLPDFDVAGQEKLLQANVPVSYTHLTLPTKQPV